VKEANRFLFGPVPSRRFGLHVNEAAKFTGEWTRRKLVAVVRRDGEMYYSASSRAAGARRA
jgi:hypothetical protein